MQQLQIDNAVSQIIEKWYKALKFDSKFDAEFYEALQTIPISPDTNISTYPLDTMEGKKNLLSFLYMCEQVEKEYQKNEICDEILLDTLSDIVVWCNEWSRIKGELFLGTTGWLSNHMRLQLFKLGRLQFCIEPMNETLQNLGAGGDYYIGVHIPACGPLSIEDCERSFVMAKTFLEEYYPQVNYTHFSCNSWLLDDTLREFLPPKSNILRFAEMFTIVDSKESDDITRYVFGRNITRENIGEAVCHSAFAGKIKKAIMGGKQFYCVRGLIAK